MKKKDLKEIIKMVKKTIKTDEDLEELISLIGENCFATELWYEISPNEDDSATQWSEEVRVPKDEWEFLKYVFEFCEVEFLEAIEARVAKEGGTILPGISEKSAHNKIMLQFKGLKDDKRFDDDRIIEELSGGLIDWNRHYGYYRVQEGKDADAWEYSFDFLGPCNEFSYRW